jgi:hypothetical protein
MTEESQDLERRLAYIDQVRAIARRERNLGFVCCLLGVLGLAFAAYRLEAGAFSTPGVIALATIVFGWALFAYAIVKRTRYVRAHPFDPTT